MKKRRIILVLVAAVMAVMLVMSGCGKSADKSDEKDTKDKDKAETVEVVKPDIKDKTIGKTPPQIVKDDDNGLIFYNRSGIFCYDYSKGKIDRALDVASMDTNFPLSQEGDETAFVVPDKDKNEGDLIILKRSKENGEYKLADYYYVYNVKDNTLKKINETPDSKYLDMYPENNETESWVMQSGDQPLQELGFRTKDGKVINVFENY